MKTVYVVQGSCGEYSDHMEWMVRAFMDEEKAKAFVILATEQGNALRLKYAGKYWCEEKTEADPNFQWDYSGFNYTYYSIPLED